MEYRRPALRRPASLFALVLVPLAALVTSPSPAAPPPLQAPLAVQATFLPPDPGPLQLRRVRLVASRARPAQPVFVAPDGERITVERVRRFLLLRGSPMAPYATTIVAAGVANRVDPRVVVAIAGVESSFGIYRRGYNAWGWDVAHVRFHSWDDAIRRFTQAMSFRYPGMRYGAFAAGAGVYDPPDPSSWTAHCTSYFRSV